jgi:hypothetical protein
MTDTSELKHQYYLAVIPFAAYCCVLAFEAGRYAFLGIPAEYVELSSQRIAQLGFITILSVLGLFILITHLIELAESSSQTKSLLGRIVLWGLPIIGTASLLSPHWTTMLMAIGVTLVKSTDPYPTEQHEIVETEESVLHEQFVKKRMSNFRNNTIWLIVFIGTTSLIFYRAGELFQTYNDTSLVFVNSQNSIVVGTYSGSLLVKTYDIKSKKLFDGFRLEQFDSKLTLAERKTGRLSK